MIVTINEEDGSLTMEKNDFSEAVLIKDATGGVRLRDEDEEESNVTK